MKNEILHTIKDMFGEYFITVCSEKGHALVFCEDLAEDLFIRATEHENFDWKKELNFMFSTNFSYREMYEYCDLDTFTEKDVKNDYVMFNNNKFYVFRGEEYIEERIENLLERFGKEFVIEYVEKTLLPITQKYIEDAKNEIFGE